MATKHKSTMTEFKIAVLDLNNGVSNEGIRCIKKLIMEFYYNQELMPNYQVFDVRAGDKLPNASDFDAYISSGGPGSPILENTPWEKNFFTLVDEIREHNQNSEKKIYFFGICHSFQLLVQHFQLAKITKRRSSSFGVMPMHKVTNGLNEPLLKDLPNPFWAVDSRDYQAVQPNLLNLEKMGASIICIEKDRPHVRLERAIMAIRFTPEIFGTQFHPEADAEGMHRHFQTEEKKNMVIQNFGEEKFNDMIHSLEEPEKIMLTESIILPNFIETAYKHNFERDRNCKTTI